jgi:hypothetical protein
MLPLPPASDCMGRQRDTHQVALLSLHSKFMICVLVCMPRRVASAHLVIKMHSVPINAGGFLIRGASAHSSRWLLLLLLLLLLRVSMQRGAAALTLCGSGAARGQIKQAFGLILRS